jgi:hypothetical protein
MKQKAHQNDARNPLPGTMPSTSQHISSVRLHLDNIVREVRQAHMKLNDDLVIEPDLDATRKRACLLSSSPVLRLTHPQKPESDGGLRSAA